MILRVLMIPDIYCELYGFVKNKRCALEEALSLHPQWIAYKKLFEIRRGAPLRPPATATDADAEREVPGRLREIDYRNRFATGKGGTNYDPRRTADWYRQH